MRTLVGLLLLLVFAGCDLAAPDHADEVRLRVPPTFPPVPVPDFNPLDERKVELGKRLFFDPILSADRTISCASCHDPERAFADPRPVSIGVEGRAGIRNSPSLVNVAYGRLFFWDGGALTLENQVLAPLEDHREMDADLAEILQRLREDPEYSRLFNAVFDEAPSIPTLTRAIAAYERTLLSGGSRYDRFLDGQVYAMTAQEKDGMALFEGAAGCATCHRGFLLTTGEFVNNGLAFAAADSGRARITLDSGDFARFKVPSLRNVALTAPYMHDGRLATLEDVIAHYDAGGTGSRGQHEAIRPLHLTAAEREALVAFLMTLTDEVVYEGIP